MDNIVYTCSILRIMLVVYDMLGGRTKTMSTILLRYCSGYGRIRGSSLRHGPLDRSHAGGVEFLGKDVDVEFEGNAGCMGSASVCVCVFGWMHVYVCVVPPVRQPRPRLSPAGRPADRSASARARGPEMEMILDLRMSGSS
jgi:hypothetical protein